MVICASVHTLYFCVHSVYYLVKVPLFLKEKQLLICCFTAADDLTQKTFSRSAVL